MIQRVKNLLFQNTSARQTVVKNTFWLFFGEGMGRLIRAAIVIYSARLLGAAEYGLFSYAMAVSGFVSIFSDLGISAILTRESTKNPQARQEYFSTALAIKLFFIIINTALILFAVPLIARVGGVFPLLPLVALLTIFDTLREFSFGMSRAMEKMEWEALTKIFTNIAVSGLGFLLLWLSASAYSLTVGYVLGSALGFLATVFILLPYFRTFYRHIRGSLVMPILQMAWPIGLLGVLGSIMINTDMVMLGWWRSAEQIGYYAAGQKPIQLLYIVPALLASAVFPTLARLANVNNERFKMVLEKSIAAALLLGLPVVTVGAVLAGKLIPFVYGAEYVSAVATFNLLLGTVIVVFPSTILANALFAYNEQRQFLWFVGVGALSNAALDYFLIPLYGIEGACVATLISQILTNTLVWYKMKQINNFTILHRLPRILLASVASAGVALLCTYAGVPVLITLAISAAFYLGTLWALREPLFHEVREVLTSRNS